MKKMNMLVALFVVLLCSSFTLGKGKGKNKDVYMAGVSASFSDSLIFFTDIQLVDSVELDKDRYYSCTLNGPDYGSTLEDRPRLKITFSAPKTAL